MSDAQLLFIVLAVIYGWECAWWVSRGSFVFRNWLYEKTWQLVEPGVLLGNRRGGFIFGNPLPPLGSMIHASEPPLIMSPKGFSVSEMIETGGPAVASGKFVAWSEIDRIEVKGKKLFINNKKLLNADSVALAETFSRLLLELKEAKNEKREELIRKWLSQTFATGGLRDKWKLFSKQTRFLVIATNVLFCFIFIISPVVVSLLGFRGSWMALLAGILALTTTISILFRRAHKKLYPQLEEERFTHFIIALLSPATAIRVRDVLSRPLFMTCHPLALARIFCAPAKFRERAEESFRRSVFFRATKTADAELKEVEMFWNEARQAAVEKFLRKNEIEPSELLKPPAPLEQACRSYCPRCHAQFTTDAGACEDCGGVILKPLNNSVAPQLK